MKNLYVLLLVASLFSCEKEEVKVSDPKPKLTERPFTQITINGSDSNPISGIAVATLSDERDTFYTWHNVADTITTDKIYLPKVSATSPRTYYARLYSSFPKSDTLHNKFSAGHYTVGWYYKSKTTEDSYRGEVILELIP